MRGTPSSTLRSFRKPSQSASTSRCQDFTSLEGRLNLLSKRSSRSLRLDNPRAEWRGTKSAASAYQPTSRRWSRPKTHLRSNTAKNKASATSLSVRIVAPQPPNSRMYLSLSPRLGLVLKASSLTRLLSLETRKGSTSALGRSAR